MKYENEIHKDTNNYSYFDLEDKSKKVKGS